MTVELTFLLRHSLVYGGLLSLLTGSLFIGLGLLNPEIWVNDYPPDIRKKYGPAGSRAKRLRNLASIPLLAIWLGLFALSTVRLAQANAGQLGFLEVALHVFLMLLVFNLVDLLVLDWLIFVTLRPARIVLPGTEGMAGYRDYAFHLRAFLKGLAGAALVAVVVGALAALMNAL